MGQTKVIMPQMGESVAEGTVAKWLKQPGDRVEKDENILEINTDKIDVEVPAPASGYLIQILIEEGATVEVGTVLAVIADSADEAATVAAAAAPKKVEKAKAVEPAAPAREPEPEPGKAKPAVSDPSDKRKFYTPVVLRMAAEQGIDLERVAGTGMGGRVTKKDLLNYIEEMKSAPAPPAAAASAPKPAMKLDGGEEVIAMSNVRKKTAEHMIRSKQTSAHVTSMQEVDMTPIVRYREPIKEEFKRQNGFPLTYMAIIAKEVVETLKEFPHFNSSVDGDNIIVKHYINLGMAVALPDDTLIVPIIKNADDLSVRGLARAVYDIAQRARNRKLTMDDIEGGTFTITNHGLFGSVFGTPIISQPQVAILGTGAIRKRAVVLDNDAIAVRHVMFLSLTYDHRIIDGSYGGRFSQRLTERLESWDPSRM